MREFFYVYFIMNWGWGGRNKYLFNKVFVGLMICLDDGELIFLFFVLVFFWVLLLFSLVFMLLSVCRC